MFVQYIFQISNLTLSSYDIEFVFCVQKKKEKVIFLFCFFREKSQCLFYVLSSFPNVSLPLSIFAERGKIKQWYIKSSQRPSSWTGFINIYFLDRPLFLNLDKSNYSCRTQLNCFDFDYFLYKCDYILNTYIWIAQSAWLIQSGRKLLFGPEKHVCYNRVSLY